MVAIAIREFDGEAPKVEARSLPVTMAQIAINCKLWSSLEAFNDVLQVIAPTKPAATASMYRLGQGLPETQYWLTWGTDVDVARGQIAGDTTERTYYTGDGVPKVTDAALASTGGTNYPMNSYTLGLPKPTAAPTVAVTGVATPGALPEDRIYVETFVSAWGEESEPSPASTAATYTAGQTITLSALNANPTGAYQVTHRRIYRSNSGSYSTQFQFVVELPIATVSYVDTVAGTALGELLPTTYWTMPPADLSGLIALPNGVMAGFSKNELCLCEPYKPYAWPIAYRYSMDFPIVGIGHYGSTIIVGTTGTPYQGSGVDPASMTFEKMPQEQACVSKRSMVSMGTGVAYASPDGLIFASGGNAVLATKDHFTRDQWQALNPSSIHAYLLDGRYIGFYDNGTTQGGFIFSPSDGRDGLVMIDTYATAGYVDPVLDALYLRIGANIVRWDSHATNKKTLTWRSKVFSAPRPVNMAYAQVFAASFPLTVKIYGDGVLKHTQTVASSSPFSLPGGYLATEWEIEVSGTSKVYALFMAESMDELKNG